MSISHPTAGVQPARDSFDALALGVGFEPPPVERDHREGDLWPLAPPAAFHTASGPWDRGDVFVPIQPDHGLGLRPPRLRRPPIREAHGKRAPRRPPRKPPGGDDMRAGARALLEGLVVLMLPPSPQYGEFHERHNFREEATLGVDRNPRKALQEWIEAANFIQDNGGEVVVMPLHIYSDLGVSDAVFAANHGYLVERGGNPLFLGARFIHPIRQGESHLLQQFWEKMMGVPFEQPGGLQAPTNVWEGQADISRVLPGNRIILTHGVRTTLWANDTVRHYFPSDTRFLDVQIKEPFFHGDTCINVIRNKSGKYYVLYYPGAMNRFDLERFLKFVRESGATPIPISEQDALYYVANSLEVNGTIFLLNEASREIEQKLIAEGFDVVKSELNELFMKGGGGTRCCVLELRGIHRFPELRSQLIQRYKYHRGDWEPLVYTYQQSAKRQFQPHTFDSRPPVLRSIPRGEKPPASFTQLKEVLDEGDLVFGPVVGGGPWPVAPDRFLITRGNEVAVNWHGGRLPVQRLRPGALIRIRREGERTIAEAVTMEELNAKDLVLMTESKGIGYAEDSRQGDGTIKFGFERGRVSPERAVEAQALRVAQVMLRMKMEGKKIVFVGGPGIAHSDASKYLAALISHGFVDVLYTGNALATHDLELNHKRFGTSLGYSPELEMQTGNGSVPLGERHHLMLINEARQRGSLEALVNSGWIGENSVVAAAIRNRVSIVAAGSIRDDGPLPGVITDVAQGNRVLRDQIHDAGIVIGIATFLHSSAAVQQVPATTPKVLVDVDEDVLLNLGDINPMNTLLVESPAAAFLKMLCEMLWAHVDHLALPTPMGILSRDRVLEGQDRSRGEPERDITTVRVTQQGVAPDGFLTTTNEPTELKVGIRWLPVEGQKMDGVFVVDRAHGRAKVKVYRELEVGDEVVIGEDGVKRTLLSGIDTPRTIREVAQKLVELRESGKGVFLVAGDALIRSGSGRHVAALIKRGYIKSIHSGSALPLYEEEKIRFDTIGKNDLRALNVLRSVGGLGRNGDEGSIFTAAREMGIEVIVSASPNDSGIVPGAVTDMNEAQARVKKAYQKAGMVLNVASVLHSIGAGNLGPGNIPVVVVDNRQFSIEKLASRGTVQAHGFKMDVGDFFETLMVELDKRERDRGSGAPSAPGSGGASVQRRSSRSPGSKSATHFKTVLRVERAGGAGGRAPDRAQVVYEHERETRLRGRSHFGEAKARRRQDPQEIRPRGFETSTRPADKREPWERVESLALAEQGMPQLVAWLKSCGLSLVADFLRDTGRELQQGQKRRLLDLYQTNDPSERESRMLRYIRVVVGRARSPDRRYHVARHIRTGAARVGRATGLVRHAL